MNADATGKNRHNRKGQEISSSLRSVHSLRLPSSDFGFRPSFGFRVSDFGFPSASSRSAFTLLEMLLALAISAIVLAGIGGVFFSALRLRERTTALLDESLPLYRAVDFLRRDLKGALPPGGVMVGDFKIGPLDSGVGQSVGLQFSTTTGILSDNTPWGDVQEVTYELRDPAVRTANGGKELVRSTTRNLLSTGLLDYNDQSLLSNIDKIEYAGYDGMNWRDLWDTSLTDTNPPMAVRVRIYTVADQNLDLRNRQPVELIVPIITQSRTNQTTQAALGGEE